LSAPGPPAIPFGGDCSISTWLMRIALNLIRDIPGPTAFASGTGSETAVDVSDIASHVPHRDSSLECALSPASK